MKIESSGRHFSALPVLAWLGLLRLLPPKRGVSTRLRILGWYMLIMALAMILGLFLIRSALLAQMEGEINSQLRQEVDELNQLTTGRDPSTGQPFGDDVGAIFETFLRRNVPVADEALFTIVDGQPFASTVAPAQLLEEETILTSWASVDQPTQDDIGTIAGPVRYLAVPVFNQGQELAGVFVVAIFLEGRRADINRVINIGAIVFGSTFVVASGLAWFAAGRALKPVGALTSTARSISESNWKERIPIEANDELSELAVTFNEMLDRLETAFSQQRRFIDDASHELRTPITIIRGHLELLNADDKAATEDTRRLVLDELDRMSRLVDDLLLLARSEQPDFLDVHPIDIAELVDDVAAKAAPLAKRGLKVGERAVAVIDGDRHRVTQALMNLIHNAAAYSPESAQIRLGSVTQESAVEIWVQDEGPGIDPEDQQHVFDRFARGTTGQRRTEGAGLGLAIVRVIAEAHGGSVRLDSTPGRGSRFTISLPAPTDGLEVDVPPDEGELWQ